MALGRRRGLLPVEWAACAWCLLTLLMMGALSTRLLEAGGMLLMRGRWLLMTVLLVGLGWLWPSRLTLLARITGQLVWLSQWYPDTYQFNRIFPNRDHVFASLEQALFGCQPAIRFSQLCSGTVWSELFNLGYWSYYPMMIALVLAVFVSEASHSRSSNTEEFPVSLRVSAMLLICFFIYYIIYMYVPVAGPQFYFEAIGIDSASAGRFPALGLYFSSHTGILTAPGDPDGLFYRLVVSAQAAGERPTAAFPSSHVGISTIVLCLARRHVPHLAWVLLPFYVLLCCATVYIQAHYLVDALAGLLSAPLVFLLANQVVTRTRLCR